MRKNYTLLFLMLLVSTLLSAQTLPDVKNFKISNQSLNKTYNNTDHSQVHFNFDIKGNYGTNEIKLSLYYKSVSSANLINLARWNREGDYNYNWTSYFNKTYWVSNFCDVNFSTNAGKLFILVVEYEGNQKTLTYTVPYGDSDGDGFNDNVDNCPYVAGTNNGCPLIDLVIEKIRVHRDGLLVYTTGDNSLELLQNKFYDFEVTVKNIGNSNTNGNVSLDMLFCQCNNYPSASATMFSVGGSSNIGNVNAGSTKVYNFSGIYVTDRIGTSNVLYEGQGSYRLYFDVSTSGEVSYNNNYTYIPFVYYQNRSQIQPIKTNISSTSPLNSDMDAVNLVIYDFSGKQIVNKSNITENEKKNILTELPKGYFIIKTQENKTVKIRKD